MNDSKDEIMTLGTRAKKFSKYDPDNKRMGSSHLLSSITVAATMHGTGMVEWWFIHVLPNYPLS